MSSNWASRAIAPQDAVALVTSGARVFVHGAAATPAPLLEALAARHDLEGVTLYHLHTNGAAAFAGPEHAGRFFSVSLFTGPPLRDAVNEGRADYVPIFLSDIPALFSAGRVPLDVAFLQLSPPDAHGHCSLGTSVDTALAAARAARSIVAEINDQMPRTLGNTLVPFARVNAFIHTNRPLVGHDPVPSTPSRMRLAATSRRSSLMAPRCRWASAAFRTPSCGG